MRADDAAVLCVCCRLVCEDDGWMREDGFGSHITEAKMSLYGSDSFATETKRLISICLGSKTETE